MSRTRRRPLAPTVVSLALLLWPAAAGAADAVTGVGISAHATFRHVGVQLDITGDDDGDASAALAIDVGGKGFVPAHRLSRAGANRFVGSAFRLKPGTSFQVRVSLTDPDGVTNGTLTASGTTRSEAVPVSAGAKIHVATTGSDASGDGSSPSPYATIAHALGQAAAGDTVLVHAGKYHEEVAVPHGGEAGSPITLAAAGDGPAVMTGADPALEAPSAWKSEGGGVYSAAASETRYVAADGVRLWRYESLGELQSLSVGTKGGFTFTGGKVFVRLPDDAAPAGHTIEVSNLGHALWLAGAPHFVVTGLTIRCYGAAQYSEGLMVRDGSHDVWIVGNVFENVMPGIWVKGAVDDLTVRDNTFSDPGLAEFPWAEVKAQGGMESGALAVDQNYDGQGIVFAHNTVQGTFDGLHICGDQPMTHPNNADVLENVVRHAADDGIETDGECSNVRIVGNRFEGTLVGVSTAPAVTGPTYVLRNLMVGLTNVAPDSTWMVRALKLNVGDPRPSGEVFVYHNTGVTTEPEQASFTVTDESKWLALRLRNNIWLGTDYAFYFENAGDEPFSHDFDLLHSTGARLVRYQGANYNTLAEYQSASGHCQHCVNAPPGFVDEDSGDYGLPEQSPAIDVGEVIAGINDGYAGAGPDLGALERGAENPEWPDGGVGGSGGGTGPGGSGAGAGGGGTGGQAQPGGAGGCGCRLAAHAGGTGVALVFAGWLLLARRRARRRR